MVWQSYSCVVTALSHTALPSGSAPRDVHRNFEGQLLCPGKKGQHVHCRHRRRHTPVPWTHILPISLKTLTDRCRHAPFPWTHILPISLETLTNRRHHTPVPWTHILPISLETITNRHAPVPWTLIPRLFYLGLHGVLQL